jgi:hypothetical protein
MVQVSELDIDKWVQTGCETLNSTTRCLPSDVRMKLLSQRARQQLLCREIGPDTNAVSNCHVFTIEVLRTYRNDDRKEPTDYVN